MRSRLVASIAFALGCPGVASADTALLPTEQPGIVAYAGSAYFAGGTGRLRGLYRSDGTRAGTKLLIPARGRFTALGGLALVGNELTFTTGGTPSNPGGLFRGDGSTAGFRHALVEQRPGPRLPEPEVRLSTSAPIVAGPRTYVRGGYEEGITTLYRVDWAAGTVAPVDGVGDGSIDPIATTSDGGLFFRYAGEALWFVGPSGPAVRLAGGTAQSPFGVLGNALFFRASDSAHGNEPWVTDGTPAGTHLISDLTPGTASSDVVAFAARQGAMYVVSGRSETPPRSIHTPYLLTGTGAPAPVTIDGAPAAIAGFSGTDAGGLWFRSPTGPPGTAPERLRVPGGGAVAERVPGSGFDEHGLLVVPGTRFFVSGNTLRTTDAAGITTTLATPGRQVSKAGEEPSITGLSVVGGDAWFRAAVVDHGPPVLWRSDGTPAGTGPVVTPGQIDPVDSTLTAEVQTQRDRRAPFRWTVSGTILPEGIDPATAASLCTGSVTLTTTVYGSRKRLDADRAPVRWTGTTCAFRGTVAPPARAFRGRRGKLGVSVQFRGTPHVRPWQHVQRVGLRYG